MNSLLALIQLTPSGRGAVASFLLCGENTDETFLSCWRGKRPDKHPTWGRLLLNDAEDCEEAVVSRSEEGMEIHVHGGEHVASAIKSLFQRHGAVSKTWQEHFTPGSSQRELALRLLPFAPTERTAQILLDQYNGAAGGENLAATNLGEHLVEPFRVVLAGASNAGKSSLLNAILGFQRSLTHSLPGTTRDVVSGQTALNGFPVTFFDTAGFRETGDDLERRGIDHSLRSLTDADLVVWVVDSTAEESQRPPCPMAANVLVCYNKIDLMRQMTGCKRQERESVTVSALTGEGIEELLVKVIRLLVPHPPKPGDAVWIPETVKHTALSSTIASS